MSIAEALVSNARVLALDEYSTGEFGAFLQAVYLLLAERESAEGLDSSVTYGITASIRSWCVSQQGTVVAALLQVRSPRKKPVFPVGRPCILP